MSYQQLVSEISKGEVYPVYLFYGKEPYFIEQAIAGLKGKLFPGGVLDFNYTVIDGREEDGIIKALNLANTMPFMADKRLILVKSAEIFQAKRKKKEESLEEKRGDGEKQEEKKLLEYLSSPNPATCLVFSFEGSVDSRKKIFKDISRYGKAVEFKPLKERDLIKWIAEQAKKRGFGLEAKAIEFLAYEVGGGLSFLDGELEKLELFAQGREISLDETCRLVSRPLESQIFKVIDAVAGGEKRQAVRMLKETLTVGEPPVKFLNLLARHFRLLIGVKDLSDQGYSLKEIASQLNIAPFHLSNYLAQARAFSRTKLVAAMEMILEADLAIKTGEGDALLVIEMLILKLLQK